MKKLRFTEVQIFSIPKQADAWVAVNDLRRQAGISVAHLLPVEEQVRWAGSFRPASGQGAGSG